MSGDHNKYHMKVEFPERFKKERNRKKQADYRIGAWLSAALEDPSTCQLMKDDINEWFKCTPQEEVNRLRAKKKQIYEDLKDAVDREWVGLTDQEKLKKLCEALDSAQEKAEKNT
jgi:hypothetical protein